MDLLAIFAKVPQLGKVKTRLAKDIGDSEALRVYTGFLEKLISEHSNQEYKLIVYFASDEKEMDKYYSSIKVQKGKDLGERLFNCFETELSDFDKVIVIGSDHPTISSSDILEAFSVLDSNDVVIGPAEDGGYYLIGMKQFHDLFEGIAWSTSEVLKQTLEKCKDLNAGLLEKKFDIDTSEDLKRYQEVKQ